MAGFDNEVMFSIGERLQSSSTQAIGLMQQTATDVSIINHVGNPNGVVPANPSSLSHDPVSGNIWRKVSGTGTTVWELETSNGVRTLTGNAGGAIPPDGAGNINILLAHTNILMNGVSHTLTADFLDPTFGNLIMGSTVAQTLNPLLAQNLTGYGSAALNAVVSSKFCVGIGGGSLEDLTTGSFNTMLGASSGSNLLTTNSNTGCGYGVLNASVVGAGNTAVGSLALTFALGSNNIAIGSDSGINYTGVEGSNILINHAGVLGESNKIRIGTNGGGAGQQNACFVAGITGVTVAASAPVGVDANSQLSSLGFGSSTQVLTSNGAGNSPTWQPVSASGAVITLTGNTGGAVSPDGSGNINVITDNATVFFAKTAASTMKLDFGTNNLLLGTTGSLTSGNANVSMGQLALANTTSGPANVALGFSALQDNTSGGSNVAIGLSALQHNVTGASNVAVGNNSMAAFNSALPPNNFTNNTAVGNLTFSALTTGINNVAIGNRAGQSYTTSESSNILITNVGVIGESNIIRIGTDGSGAAQQNACYIAGIQGSTVAASAPVGVNASSQLSSLGFGSVGQVLTSTGAASSPTWQNGASVLSITSVNHAASPYTVLAADEFIACQTSTGTITLLLPNAPTTGRVIYIKDSNGAANASNISVTTVGGTVTIDGATTYTMNTNYASISVIFDSANYQIF